MLRDTPFWRRLRTGRAGVRCVLKVPPVQINRPDVKDLRKQRPPPEFPPRPKAAAPRPDAPAAGRAPKSPSKVPVPAKAPAASKAVTVAPGAKSPEARRGGGGEGGPASPVVQKRKRGGGRRRRPRWRTIPTRKRRSLRGGRALARWGGRRGRGRRIGRASRCGGPLPEARTPHASSCKSFSPVTRYTLLPRLVDPVPSTLTPRHSGPRRMGGPR